MPKVKTKTFRVQNYRTQWEKEAWATGWLSSGDTPNKAYCSVCDKQLSAGKSELINHTKSKVHTYLQMTAVTSNTPMISFEQTAVPETAVPQTAIERSFNFTEELDFRIAEEVLRNNPFEIVNGERRWVQTVQILKGEDKCFASLTSSMVKERIRFLIEKFTAISFGRMPVKDDKMGNILYKLEQSKHYKTDNPRPRRRKVKSPPKASSSSPISNKQTDTEKEVVFDLEHDMPVEQEEEDAVTGSTVSPSRRIRSPSPPPTSTTPGVASSSLISESQELGASSSSTSEGQMLCAFLAYLKQKDIEDRKLRQQELELSRDKLEQRKLEMEFFWQRYEFEQRERSTQLELLKAQMDYVDKTARFMEAKKHQANEYNPKEYTIVLEEPSSCV